MAGRGRRLGTVLTEHPTAEAVREGARSAVDPDALLRLIGLLVGTASANGQEAELAMLVADAVSAEVPDAAVTVDAFDSGRANLHIDLGSGSGPGTGLYAHLDTSLLGDPGRDRWITGRDDEPAPLRVQDGQVIGHGVAVAKGSVAAGIVGAIAAHQTLQAAETPHRIRILLASGGTHRAPAGDEGDESATFGPGIRRALRTGWAPASVLNVKAGAPAPVLEEPGAAYLSLTIRGTWDPVLFRDDDPGTLAALGVIVPAVERARRTWRAMPLPAGSRTGRELGLGAVRSGALDKPDLFPALIEAAAFAVLAPGDSPESVADLVRGELADALTESGLDHLSAEVRVTRSDLAPAGTATSPSSPLARTIDEVWTQQFGPPPEVEDWRGSTDSVVLRAAGIPTVRCGPLVSRDESDARLDRTPLEELVSFARLYAEVVAIDAARPDIATATPAADVKEDHT